jgi:hypothetical protein
MADATKKCAHEDCKCSVPPARADGYCSDYCARDAGHSGHSHACACGHPACKS